MTVLSARAGDTAAARLRSWIALGRSDVRALLSDIVLTCYRTRRSSSPSTRPDLWDVGYLMEPADYWLSTELSDAIDAWYLFWENHFDFERGWDDPQSRAQWAQTGERVLAGLRREVDAFPDVRYEPWPLS